MPCLSSIQWLLSKPPPKPNGPSFSETPHHPRATPGQSLLPCLAGCRAWWPSVSSALFTLPSGCKHGSLGFKNRCKEERVCGERTGLVASCFTCAVSLSTALSCGALFFCGVVCPILASLNIRFISFLSYLVLMVTGHQARVAHNVVPV